MFYYQNSSTQVFQALPHLCVYFSAVCEHSLTLYNDPVCVCVCVLSVVPFKTPNAGTSRPIIKERSMKFEKMYFMGNKEKKYSNFSIWKQKTDVNDIFRSCSKQSDLWDGTHPSDGSIV